MFAKGKVGVSLVFEVWQHLGAKSEGTILREDKAMINDGEEPKNRFWDKIKGTRWKADRVDSYYSENGVKAIRGLRKSICSWNPYSSMRE